MKSGRRLPFLSQIAISLLIIVVVLYPYMLIPVKAAGPTISNTCYTATKNTTNVSCALTIAAIGDLIVVAVTAYMNTASCPPSVSTNSTGGSETFLRIGNTSCQNQAGNGGEQVWMSYFVATSSSSHTVSVTLSSGVGTNGYLTIGGYDTSGTPVTIVGTVQGSGTANTVGSYQSTSSIAFQSPSVLIAAIIPGIATTSATAGTGFTTTTGSGSGLSLCETTLQEYSTTATLSSPTSFPWQVGSIASCGAPPNGLWLELGVAVGTPGQASNNSNLGSCPPKNTATFTMVNSTQYFYTGSWLSNEVINNASVEIASVNSGHASSETIRMQVYITASAGGISASNPLVLAAQSIIPALSVTSTPQRITWPFGYSAPQIPPGATVAISVIGNNKIILNQSSLAGLQTGTAGSIVSGTALPTPQFTSLSASGTQLFFCANSSFQTVVTTTATTTVTTSTIVTSTTSITSINPGSNSNLPLVLLFLFLPAGIFYGVGRNLSGGLLGLIIGAIVCAASGILTPFLVTGIIIACVALAFVVGRGGANG